MWHDGFRRNELEVAKCFKVASKRKLPVPQGVEFKVGLGSRWEIFCIASELYKEWNSVFSQLVKGLV